MARYLINVRSPMAPAEAFAYMADLRNFAEWDPGVDDVDQVDGDGPGPDAAFDVGVKLPGWTMTLRYETVVVRRGGDHGDGLRRERRVHLGGHDHRGARR